MLIRIVFAARPDAPLFLLIPFRGALRRFPNARFVRYRWNCGTDSPPRARGRKQVPAIHRTADARSALLSFRAAWEALQQWEVRASSIAARWIALAPNHRTCACAPCGFAIRRASAGRAIAKRRVWPFPADRS